MTNSRASEAHLNRPRIPLDAAPDFLDVADTAAVLGVSPATVRRMHREGVLTNVLPTKKLIVSKAQLRRLQGVEP